MEISTSSGSAVAGLVAQTQKSVADATLVTKTLDYMNSADKTGSISGALSANYDFQKTVLSAAYTGKGGTINTMI